MSTQLDNTYGAAFIGMIVAAVLYGVSCVQALYYYVNQNDSWYIKSTVIAVMIFDTVHQALITHSVYTYTITDWGDPARLGLVVWSLVAEVIFTGITAFIVQSFLTMRIWQLSNRNIYLTGISAILVVGGFVTLIVYVAIASKLESLTELVRIEGLSIAVNVFNAVTDLLIAATLCTLLNTARTGFHKSEVVINRLIVFTVNTGLLTSLCAMASLISILAARKTFIFMAFFFCLGRLYTNTLLATFNAREIIQKVDTEGGSTDISFPLRDFRKTGPNQTQSLSINIDMTTQKSRSDGDQTLEEKPAYNQIPYDAESSKKVLAY